MTALSSDPLQKTNEPASPRRATARAWSMGFLLLGALFFSMIVTAGIGSAHYSPGQVFIALRHGPPNLNSSSSAVDPVVLILWNIRIPRILLAALIGASLAAAGVALQSLLRNDLADPYLVGASSGASVGSEIVLINHGEGWAGGFGLPMAAFASAIAAMSVVYKLAQRGNQTLVTHLLLAGVVISAFLGSISAIILQLGNPGDAFRTLNRLMGSLTEATFNQCLGVAVFFVFGLLILLFQARSMNIFALGEISAQQLGVETERFKTILIITGSLLTASTVAVAGIIGFVGMIVPHIARRLAGTPDHLRVLPIATLAGAVLMVWADTAARSVMPDHRELPVGIITSLLGAPFFIYLLRRQSSAR